MPVVDKRAAAHQHDQGSDIGLEVHLSEAIAETYFGDSAVEGWYIIGTLGGGSLARQVESEPVRDEFGRRTGKKLQQSDEYALENAFHESDDATLDLLDNELVLHKHKYRYALPAGEIQVDDDPVVMGPAHQVYGFLEAQVEPGWEQQLEAGSLRGRPFTLIADASQVVRATVSLAHEEDWPAKLNPFKTGGD